MTASVPFSLAELTVLMGRDGSASRIETTFGPAPPVEGWNIGLATMKQSPPHGGEIHPDGDELLFLLSGEITVVLEEETERRVELRAGQSFIVPRGVWHRVLVRQPVQLLYMTPGPNSRHRPRP